MPLWYLQEFLTRHNGQNITQRRNKNIHIKKNTDYNWKCLT